MENNLIFGSIIISTTALSLVTSIFGICNFVRRTKRTEDIFTSMMIQILVWDVFRCLTVGLVSGVSYLTSMSGSQSLLCSVVGPLTDMSHRLPFFLVMGHVILAASQSNTARCSGVGLVLIGYLVSAVFAILPFLRGNSYEMGVDGFCTYYAEAVLDIDYDAVSEKDLLLSNIYLSVAPFLLVFAILTLVGVFAALSYNSEDLGGLVSWLSLVLCYSPMCGVAGTLVAYYNDALTESPGLTTQQFMRWLQMLAMIALPVSTPLLRTFISQLAYRFQANDADKTINMKYSFSTTSTILTDNTGSSA